MAEGNDSFTESGKMGERKDNVNIQKNDESETSVLIDDCQNLEKEGSSSKLAPETSAQDEESDSSLNLRYLEFEPKIELRIQEVETSENIGRRAAEILCRKLYNVRSLSAECEIRIDRYIYRLRTELRRCTAFRLTARVVQLQEMLSLWQPLYDSLIHVVSAIDLMIGKIEDSDFLTHRFANALTTTCCNFESKLNRLERVMQLNNI